MRTSFIAAVTLASFAAARAPLALKDVKPVLYQPDCDPTWQECEMDMEGKGKGPHDKDMDCEDGDEECMERMMQEKGEMGEKGGNGGSILMYALPASVMSFTSGMLLWDRASSYRTSEENYCTSAELDGVETCVYGDGILGEVQGYFIPGYISLGYGVLALAGSFMPGLADTVSKVGMALVLNGVYTLVVKSGFTWEDCSAEVITAEYFCTPTAADAETYAINTDFNADKTKSWGNYAALLNLATAGLGFLMMSASKPGKECAEGDEECKPEGKHEMCEDEYGEPIDCPKDEECLDYYGEVIDCPEEDDAGSYYVENGEY